MTQTIKKFGVPLDVIMRREDTYKVPEFLNQCFEVVVKNADSEGFFFFFFCYFVIFIFYFLFFIFYFLFLFFIYFLFFIFIFYFSSSYFLNYFPKFSSQIHLLTFLPLKFRKKKKIGIFRLSGMAESLRESAINLDRGVPLEISTFDEHSVTGILKQFFRFFLLFFSFLFFSFSFFLFHKKKREKIFKVFFLFHRDLPDSLLTGPLSEELVTRMDEYDMGEKPDSQISK